MSNQAAAGFDVSKNWIILLPPKLPNIKKSTEDLSRYIGLLAGGDSKKPLIADANGSAPSCPIIALNITSESLVRNGFSWRAKPERVEIFGESSRGLNNGIYSFLAALGISWPAAGEEKLPVADTEKKPGGASIYPLARSEAHEPSCEPEQNTVAASWKRLVLSGKGEINNCLNKSEAFAAWAARNQYDAVIFPMSYGLEQKLKQLRLFAAEYEIAVEMGGWELSSLVPRKHFFLHRDFFRMEKGQRKKDHNFCPTSPGALQLIAKEGAKLFRQETKVFHLWPDKDAETLWCTCPTCRAFTVQEQNIIALNAAADVLTTVNPGAFICYYEKNPGEGGKLLPRKNTVKLEKLPEELKK